MSLVLFLAAATAQPALSPEFEAAIDAYITCLGATVQIGMITKMEPATFAKGFMQSCLTEEKTFFKEAVKYEVANGKTVEEAEAQYNAQIAKGRLIYVQDQASYIATGKVPK